MKRILLGVTGLFIVIFGLNLYNYKITQKPENKQKIQNTLKGAGVDEDTINAFDDTMETMNSGIEAVAKAKDLLSNVVGSDMVQGIKDAPAAESDNADTSDKSDKPKELTESAVKKAGETIDKAKQFANDEELRREVANEVKDEITTRAEELPSLSEEDVDDIVDIVTERIKESCSEENIEYYLQNKDLQEFNGKLTNEVTQDKYGFISDFMKMWLEKAPSLEEFDPLKKYE